MECTIETVKINEDCNVIARHFCGNLWWELQTDSHSFFTHTISLVYLHFVILNYKELANFGITSDDPLTITRDFPAHNTILLGFSLQ